MNSLPRFSWLWFSKHFDPGPFSGEAVLLLSCGGGQDSVRLDNLPGVTCGTGVSAGVSRWQVTVARCGPFPVPGAVSAGSALVACLTTQEPEALAAVL